MKKLLLSLSLLSLGACSTVVSGTTQPFTVKTEQTAGAQCELTDSKGARWTVADTPGTVEITKGDGPLQVTCSKAGYKTASVTVQEGFAGATLGNVILGGGIGIIVDAASGAAQEYPDDIVVWLEPNSFASAAAKEEFFAAKEEYEAKLEAEKAANQPQNADGEESYN